MQIKITSGIFFFKSIDENMGKQALCCTVGKNVIVPFFRTQFGTICENVKYPYPLTQRLCL